MLGFFIVLITFVVGHCLASLLPIKWYRLEFWSVAYLIGLLCTTWGIFLISTGIGYAVGIPLALLTLLGGACLLYAKWNIKSKYLVASNSLKVTLILHLVFWSLLLWFLFTTRLFLAKTDGLYSGGTTWADLAMHSTLIHSFADHTIVDLTSPIYSQQKTTYPFLFDFYTAMLFKTGFSLQTSLVLTSMCTALAFILLCFFLMLRVTGSQFAAQLTSTLFLFNSNTGTWYFFTEWHASGKTLFAFLRDMKENYVHYPDKELHWAQYITDYILPQRGILVGLSAFLFVCYLLYYSLQKEKKTPAIFAYALALTLGGMPFFHIHTFFVLVGIIGWFLLQSTLHHQLNWKTWIGPGLLATALAIPQLYWQFSQTFDSNFSRFSYGWYTLTESIPHFWLRNLGMEAPLALLGIVLLFYYAKTPSFLKLLILPLSILFIICNFVIFQPNEWDNTKFMIYSHFGFTIAIVLVLERLRKFHLAALPLISILVISLTLGGALAVIRELNTSWKIADSADITLTEFVRKNTAPSAVFLTADTHNHPIPMLTGRPIVMGYRGWLWTYGIEYNTVERDVLAMYQGKQNSSQLLNKYDVEYVYIGSREKEEFEANENFYRQYPILYTSQTATIYQVKNQ